MRSLFNWSNKKLLLVSFNKVYNMFLDVSTLFWAATHLGASKFFSPEDWETLSGVCQKTNLFCKNGPRSIDREYRKVLYNTVKVQLLELKGDENFFCRDILGAKINRLKFYQVASLINQYDAAKNFGFRYFSNMWCKVLQISASFHKMHHPVIMMLASSFKPGVFWTILYTYVEHSFFVKYPIFWTARNPIEQKVLLRYALNRGLPLPSTALHFADELFLGAIHRFSGLFAIYPGFANAMKGKWNSLYWILYKHEKNPFSHFPLPCSEVGCTPSCPWGEWEPPTEILPAIDDRVQW